MNKKVTTNIVKETEKAYQLNVLYWTFFDKPEKTATMWVPKSCCDIEDGKVTGIAEWILDKWIKDYNDRISYYRSRSNRVSFDMEQKEYLMKKEEDKNAAFKAELAETLEVVAEYAKPYADRYMRELGFIALFISKNYTDVIPSNILNEFENIGNKIAKEFGAITRDCYNSDKWFDYWDNKFMKCYTTLESVRNFLVRELHLDYAGNAVVYDVSLYDYRLTLTLSNGKRIEPSMIDKIIMHDNTPEKSLLGKKFKSNWKFYNELKRITESMFNNK